MHTVICKGGGVFIKSKKKYQLFQFINTLVSNIHLATNLSTITFTNNSLISPHEVPGNLQSLFLNSLLPFPRLMLQDVKKEKF